MSAGTNSGPNVGSAAFRVCLYFAANPDEELLTGDIATKFGMELPHVRIQLRLALLGGLLSSNGRCSPGWGKQTTWRAGPELLRVIGREPLKEAA